MTNADRAEFLKKIADLDLEIGDALAGGDLPHLVALAGKSALVAAAAMLYQQPGITCICCDRPADPNVPGDLDLCTGCYNALSAPDPGLDESWAEYLAEMIEGEL